MTVKEEAEICGRCVLPQCDDADPGCELAPLIGITPRKPKVVKVVEAKAAKSLDIRKLKRQATVPKKRKTKPRPERAGYFKEYYQRLREKRLRDMNEYNRRMRMDEEFRAERQLLKDSKVVTEHDKHLAAERVKKRTAEFRANPLNAIFYSDTSHFGTLKALYAGNINNQ